MRMLPLRLTPGQDLRLALETAVREQGCKAAFVLSGIGSLSEASLRYAGACEATHLGADLELLTLAGTLGSGGSHLHASLSTAAGQVVGGHVAPGCIVRTTAEVLLALLPEWDFARAPDARTGHAELVVRPQDSDAAAA
ncbi:MAG TPA: PPC domain-containing DNA-binding protein [Rhizobacter sp.]|nr:PPC domain-containing DNA-binding protein [Rhizobacter sp.]